MAVSKNSVLTSSPILNNNLASGFSLILIGPILERWRQEDFREFESSWGYRDPVSKQKNLGSGESQLYSGNPFTASENSWQCVARIVTM